MADPAKPRRANRGQRTHELTEEDRKRDEDFWRGNAYFNDMDEDGSTSQDEEFEVEGGGEEEDNFDEDFFTDSHHDESHVSGSAAETSNSQQAEHSSEADHPGPSRSLFIENLMQFPYARRVHWEVKISDAQRDGPSYIKQSDNQT